MAKTTSPLLIALAALAVAAPIAAHAGAADKEVPRSNTFGGDCVKCELSGRRLHGAHFMNANFSGAALVGSDLRDAHFISSTFTGADLTRADLTDSQILGVNFSNAILTHAKLRDTQASGSVFADANLSGADFTRRGRTGLQLQPGADGRHDHAQYRPDRRQYDPGHRARRRLP